jgi:hypothetical protein
MVLKVKRRNERNRIVELRQAYASFSAAVVSPDNKTGSCNRDKDQMRKENTIAAPDNQHL